MKTNKGGQATASSSVLKAVSAIQKTGKNMMTAAVQPTIVRRSIWGRVACMGSGRQSCRATVRTKKIITMLASTMARMPPAEAPPTS